MEEYIFIEYSHKTTLKMIKLPYKEYSRICNKKCFICYKRVKISNINKHLTLGNDDTCKIIKKNKKELKINNYSLINVIFE